MFYIFACVYELFHFNRATSPVEGNIFLTAYIKSGEMVVKGQLKGAVYM